MQSSLLRLAVGDTGGKTETGNGGGKEGEEARRKRFYPRKQSRRRDKDPAIQLPVGESLMADATISMPTRIP